MAVAEVAKKISKEYERHVGEVAKRSAKPAVATKPPASQVTVKAKEIGDLYALYCGDCCKLIQGVKDDSVGYTCFSPPFSSLYSYSNEPEDMGNCSGDAEFFEHFHFLIPQLLRVTKPGRLCSVHSMQLPTTKQHHGEIGIRDFPGDIVRAFSDHGWVYHSRVVIWKDPLVAATRTKTIGLAHKQICKDSARCRQGIADYLDTFMKPGDNPEPVNHHAKDAGFSHFIGDAEELTASERDLMRMRTTDPRTNKHSHVIWRRYASPVWMDIRQTRVVGNEPGTVSYTKGREQDDEKHICLARGSLVLTREHGYIPIESVAAGNSVLTHTGNWRKVLVVENTGVRQSVKVSAHGVPNLAVTPDHKLWMRKSDWKRERDGAERCEPGWIEAGQSLGGYVNLKLPAVESPEISDTLHWWIVGRWLADGHWGAKDDLYLSIGESKYEKFLSVVGEVAGFTQLLTAYQVRLKDRDGTLRKTIANCGIGANGKHIPAEAFTLPREQASALLDGYLSGDGHFLKDRRRWMANSVSRPLMLGVAMLAQRVYGAIASVYAGRGERDSEIEGRDVHCQQDWILSFDLPQRRKKPFVLDDGAWKKVRGIEDAGVLETWNLRVEEDESYTAEGCVVKNCPLQLDVYDRCIDMWTNEGDTVFEPFGGVGSGGYSACSMGRRYLSFELKRSYFDIAVQNVKAGAKKWGDGRLFT